MSKFSPFQEVSLLSSCAKDKADDAFFKSLISIADAIHDHSIKRPMQHAHNIRGSIIHIAPNIIYATTQLFN